MLKPWMSILTIAIGSSAFAADFKVQSEGAKSTQITIHFNDEDFKTEAVQAGSQMFTRFVNRDALATEPAGTPEIPRFNRWIAVDPTQIYAISYKLSDPIEIHNVNLYPIQPDTIEDTKNTKFYYNAAAYNRIRWYKNHLEARTKAQLGRVSILPISISPIDYHARTQTLRMYRTMDISIVSRNPGDSRFILKPQELSSFEQQNLRHLVANNPAVFAELSSATDIEFAQKTYLVITNELLAEKAMVLANQHAAEDVEIKLEVVKAGVKPQDIKNLVTKYYNEQHLDAVLLFGDEAIIPLYSWSGTLGDAWYSLVAGNDNLADISIGRLPVSNLDEANLIVEKVSKYYSFNAQGNINKKVMLAAHKEEYPGKYTANQEKIKNGPNPRQLEFNTQYGGAKATNETVLEQANQGYAIINYRGHGSETGWAGWDYNGRSFSAPQVDLMKNYDQGLSVVLNIACYNGAIQNSSPALVETMLFGHTETNRGVVATLGATDPSYTEVNHRYDIAWFDYLGKSDDLSLGVINGLAANKLVQDENGSMPENNKMYILFADPYLRPWIE